MKGKLLPAKILAGALVSVVERRQALARALLIPALGYLGFEWLRLNASSDAIKGLAMILQLMAHTVFAVTTHRILLLGDQSVPSWGLQSWTRRETLFLLQVLLVSFCLVPLLLLAALPGIGILLAIGAGLLVVSRLSLVFPAAAVEQPLTIPEAWALSAPHQFPLLLMVSVVPALLGMLVSFGSTLVPVPFVASLLGLLLTVFTITMLSLSYSEVRRLEQTDAS